MEAWQKQHDHIRRAQVLASAHDQLINLESSSSNLEKKIDSAKDVCHLVEIHSTTLLNLQTVSPLPAHGLWDAVGWRPVPADRG